MDAYSRRVLTERGWPIRPGKNIGIHISSKFLKEMDFNQMLLSGDIFSAPVRQNRQESEIRGIIKEVNAKPSGTLLTLKVLPGGILQEADAQHPHGWETAYIWVSPSPCGQSGLLW